MKKIICVGMMGVVMALSPVFTVLAAEKVTYVNEMALEEVAEVYRADVIVTKFRIHNGVTQYRRWNETKGVWVDPYWIDL